MQTELKTIKAIQISDASFGDDHRGLVHLHDHEPWKTERNAQIETPSKQTSSISQSQSLRQIQVHWHFKNEYILNIRRRLDAHHHPSVPPNNHDHGLHKERKQMNHETLLISVPIISLGFFFHRFYPIIKCDFFMQFQKIEKLFQITRPNISDFEIQIRRVEKLKFHQIWNLHLTNKKKKNHSLWRRKNPIAWNQHEMWISLNHPQIGRFLWITLLLKERHWSLSSKNGAPHFNYSAKILKVNLFLMAESSRLPQQKPSAKFIADKGFQWTNSIEPKIFEFPFYLWIHPKSTLIPLFFDHDSNNHK